LDEGFALDADFDIRRHDRGWMGHADEDEVGGFGGEGRGDRRLQGGEVDGAELLGFRRRGMGRADQVDEVGFVLDGVGRGIEGVAEDDFSASRDLRFGPRAGQGDNPIPFRQKARDEALSHISC
jgi:hypothetical protein